MAANVKSNEIRITRIYDAPRQAVWEAWSDPRQVAQWWGPRGFTVTTHSHDLRTGGHWNYTMHGPDGVDYPSTTHYLLVEPGSKLVYDHGASDERAPLFRVVVLFSDLNGKTKLDMTMTLPTPEAAEETRKIIKKASGHSTWDRLAEYVEKETAGREVFVINRSFAAPIELMFEMWTDAAHFSQWLPPAGATMEFIRADIRPGGSMFYAMTAAGGAKMYGRADYLEIRRPDRLVYIQQFCDEHEKVTRHPFAPTWPLAMLTTVQFCAEGLDQTRVTVTWAPHGPATREEIDTFVKARGGMAQGWTGSLDKLEALVVAARPI